MQDSDAASHLTTILEARYLQLVTTDMELRLFLIY